MTTTTHTNISSKPQQSSWRKLLLKKTCCIFWLPANFRGDPESPGDMPVVRWEKHLEAYREPQLHRGRKILCSLKQATLRKWLNGISFCGRKKVALWVMSWVYVTCWRSSVAWHSTHHPEAYDNKCWRLAGLQFSLLSTRLSCYCPSLTFSLKSLPGWFC